LRDAGSSRKLRQAAFQALIRCSQKGRREAEKLPQAISGCKALDRCMPVPGLAELPITWQPGTYARPAAGGVSSQAGAVAACPG